MCHGSARVHLEHAQLEATAAASASASASAGSVGTSAAAAASAGAYDAWRRLSLQLEVEGPLVLLLHPRNARRYDELFGFLWGVKRVQTELQAVWASQTTTGAMPPARRAALMPLWRLRAHMSFLVDNLQYYLQVDVLDVQWLKLTRAAEEQADFEALVAAHEDCLGALHAQCFLQAGAVSSALHQILQLCLSLCRMVSYADVGAASQAAYHAQLETLQREFARQSAFLFAFLSNMSSPQASPHLAQLLLRLNFNDFFLQPRAEGDVLKPMHDTGVR